METENWPKAADSPLPGFEPIFTKFGIAYSILIRFRLAKQKKDSINGIAVFFSQLQHGQKVSVDSTYLRRVYRYIPSEE